MNQSKFLAITCNSLEARENHGHLVRLVLVLVLLLIGWNTGTTLSRQSLSVAIAVSHLKTALTQDNAQIDVGVHGTVFITLQLIILKLFDRLSVLCVQLGILSKQTGVFRNPKADYLNEV